jgi:beta-phosphoglucomutase
VIKACIFDLDGVIVDTAHYHFLAWKRLADELNINFTEHDNERLKGVSRLHSMDILLEIGGVEMTVEQRETLANKKNAWFVDFIEKMKPTDIFPGVKHLVEELRQNGIKVGLASSSKNAKTVIRLLQIQEMFDAVVDGTMVTHSKPDPEIFLLAAKLLDIDPMYCLVFEDAEAGVEAALAARMKCIGVGEAFRLKEANLIVSKTGEFVIADLQKI